ncbi:MAG: ParA family protein [Deltaproteobacteria bacterium]|nr:MAG: ParA family protein [Deltaproteobacteria bacterium]
MKVIAVANQKGGVGKTTTAVNLGASLAILEKKVLIVDMDPQGNATSYVGVDPEVARENNVYRSLIGDRPLKDLVVKTSFPNLSIVPAGPDLAGAEVELVDLERRETRLRARLYEFPLDADVVFIDCPPSLGLLTINALSAAHSVIVPLQCEYLAMEGLGRILETIEMVRSSLNPSLDVEGVLLTMFDGRNNLSHQVEEELRKHLGSIVFDTVIPRNVRISESPSFGRPVLMYAYSSRGAVKYLELAEELLEKWQKRKQD